MKSQLIYVSGHAGSEAQAKIAVESLEKFNYDVTLVEGVTPDTLNEDDFPYGNLTGGRLQDFQNEQSKKYYIKKSVLFNNLKFAQRVIEADEPMICFEHDIIATKPLPDFDFDEFCFLAYEDAFKPPSTLAKSPYNTYIITGQTGVNDFPNNYPVKYYKDSIYKGATCSPGAAAYALSPKGARKFLQAAEKGLEQNDFTINSHNLRLQYLYPSPISYQNENLNLSHLL